MKQTSQKVLKYFIRTLFACELILAGYLGFLYLLSFQPKPVGIRGEGVTMAEIRSILLQDAGAAQKDVVVNAGLITTAIMGIETIIKKIAS
jgi:hypothetical protein